MGSKLHIHLPDGSIAEYKPDHAPLDTDDVLSLIHI